MSNGHRFAAMPLAGGGTPVKDWLAADRLPTLDLSDCPALVIVAPHPDDETLGLGATTAQLTAAGVDVQVVAVSAGGAADPAYSQIERIWLERTRRAELICAATQLGALAPMFLDLPDGRLGEFEDILADRIATILGDRPTAWCAATWRGDGHPDHEAVGRAAAEAARRTGSVFLEYPVWMWHWARPADPAVPWHRAASIALSRSDIGRKRHAAQSFRSQFRSDPPVLPAYVLRRLLAVGEVVFR